MKLGVLVLGCSFFAAIPLQAQDAKVIRVGIIGTDTSHVPAFTKILNDPKAKGDVAGFKVVAAFPGGSDDLPMSKDRVHKFAAEIHDKYGVELVASIDALLEMVDVVLLESVDGRPHWKQAMPVLKARKTLFIDKPLAASLADAIRILELAKETKTPILSTSSLRFGKRMTEIREDKKLGGILGCSVHGPCAVAEHHPDLAFYGIHGLEMLFAFMGPGCKTVTRTTTADFDFVTAVWTDGRIGSYRGIRKGAKTFGATVFGAKEIAIVDNKSDYQPMLAEVCKFFRSGVSPVDERETLEILAVIDAADESKRQGGSPVSLESMFAKARGK